jgi:hypothetical protein
MKVENRNDNTTVLKIQLLDLTKKGLYILLDIILQERRM